MFKKKGVVSIATFSLIILILCLVLSFSYFYYVDSKLDVELIIKEQEVLNSVGSFRAELLNLISTNNSNLSYSNSIDSVNFEIYITNKTISGNQIFKNQLVEVNISTFGIEFCDNYTFYPNTNTSFGYNGSCVLISTT